MERFQTGIEFLSSTESFITAHGKAQTIERCAGYFEEEPAVVNQLKVMAGLFCPLDREQERFHRLPVPC